MQAKKRKPMKRGNAQAQATRHQEEEKRKTIGARDEYKSRYPRRRRKHSRRGSARRKARIKKDGEAREEEKKSDATTRGKMAKTARLKGHGVGTNQKPRKRERREEGESGTRKIAKAKAKDKAT